MVNLIKRGILFLIKPMNGKLHYQSFFEFLYNISLRGMNIGSAGVTSNSGEINVIKEINNLSNNPIIFDVGANFGDYTNLVFDTLKNNPRIYCFEPSLTTFKKLTLNLKDKIGVNIYNFGMGDKVQKRDIYSDSDHPGMTSIFNRRLDHFGISMKLESNVNIDTIDSFCLLNNIKHIDLLKIDAEGSELFILKGASKMIENRSIKIIQFEFGGCNLDSRTTFQDFFYILNDKYQLFRILNDGIYPIKKYSEKYEIFLTTNFLAKLR